MKKAFATSFMVTAAAAFAPLLRADVTNYVYTVSNIYIRVYETRYITNRVQNTHYNYYFTNNITTITNVWTVNHTTNFNYEVVNTNFGPWLVAASNAANRAASGAAAATNMATVAAGYATTAGNYSSAAQGSAAVAQSYRDQTRSAANTGLANINSRIAWFESWYTNLIAQGGIITNLNLTVDASVGIPYTSPGGTTYANIMYYPAGHVNGKVCATPTGSAHAGTEFLFHVHIGLASEYPSHDFTFEPGYADSDANGLRLHYVTKYRQLERQGYGNNSYTRLFLPRDFYWQAGNYYAVLDVYTTATNWVGRWTMKSPDRTVPDGVNETTTTYNELWNMHKYEGENHPYPNGNTGGFKTKQGSYLSNPLPIWFSSAPSAEHSTTIEWLSTFPNR